MSVLLQSLDHAKYVQNAGGWTETPKEARQFGGATEALFYCYHHHLENVRILGRFGDPGKDYTIPLRQLGVRESASGR
jgi:hypothetical protein